MQVNAFDFELDTKYIASKPIEPRDAAKMLHVQPNGNLQDCGVRDLPNLLNAGDVLVLNNTKVIPAQLEARRGGARIEVTLHMQAATDSWYAFIKPAKKVKLGDTLQFGETLEAKVTEKNFGEVRLEFNCTGDDLMTAIKNCGVMPLPPYIRKLRDVNTKDDDSYQTVYAKHEGAVAAPTAGLHFTDALLQSLKDKGVEVVYVTLHVGAGTFLPVKVDDTKDHKMHFEYGEVSKDVANIINAAKQNNKRVIAVGTTSLRVLESAALASGKVTAYADKTDLFITPGFEFKVVDCLMTNFHLPKSTLFMLISAFSGLEVMQHAYQHAMQHNYRFYSYGDACFLER